MCSRHLIPIFSVGHIPFVLLESQLAQHGVAGGVWSGVCEEGERGVVRGRWEGQGARGWADSWPPLGLGWLWAWPVVAM